jgi:serine/threonine protein kinase
MYSILLFYGGCFAEHEAGRERICLVTELCKGSLDIYIKFDKSSKGGARSAGSGAAGHNQKRSVSNLVEEPAELTEDRLLRLMEETLGGLAFMHSRGVIHRDLTPENILVSQDDHVKIADFGLSKMVGRGGGISDSQGHTANVGSPAYMAPELLKYDGSSTSHYTSAVDVYSFAIILNALWRRSDPYDSRGFAGALHLLRLVEEGRRPDVPSDCPTFLAQLMRSCWAAEPGERICAIEALDFLKGRGVVRKHERGESV